VTIRLRLATAFTLLVGLILLLTGVVTYQLLRHVLLEIQQDVVRHAQSFSRAGSLAPGDLNSFAAPDMFLQVD
jgi:hypothetical protein